MGKPLTQLVPDFREALEEGVQQATKTVVRDLQVAGPYWTGFFSDVWQVNVGKTAVKANIQNPLEVPKQPKTPQYVDIDVPESPDLQGYTIGNRAAYRLFAMDIVKRDHVGLGRGTKFHAELLTPTGTTNMSTLRCRASLTSKSPTSLGGSNELSSSQSRLRGAGHCSLSGLEYARALLRGQPSIHGS